MDKHLARVYKLILINNAALRSFAFLFCSPCPRKSERKEYLPSACCINNTKVSAASPGFSSQNALRSGQASKPSSRYQLNLHSCCACNFFMTDSSFPWWEKLRGPTMVLFCRPYHHVTTNHVLLLFLFLFFLRPISQGIMSGPESQREKDCPLPPTLLLVHVL